MGMPQKDFTPARTYKDLLVWQKAHKFVIMVYGLTKTYPKDEQFCLTSQFRRAAVSVAANIAEGFRKRSIKEKLYFLNIAQGSADECDYYLTLSKDLGYGYIEEISNLYIEVARLLNASISTMQSRA
jgi:four helix bundle protein